MKWRNGIILVIILAFIGVTIWYAWPHQSKQTTNVASCLKESGKQTKPEKGSCAPNFTLKDLNSKPKELYQNNGKPTFINFWASWCEPCQAELPYMQAAYQKYSDRINFMMVNATMTEPGEDVVRRFVKQKRYTFPVYIDTAKTNISLGKYRAPGIPVTVIVSAEGKILDKVIGTVSQKQMDHLIDQMLNE